MDKVFSLIVFGIIAIVVLSISLLLIKITVKILVYVFILALVFSTISFVYNKIIKK